MLFWTDNNSEPKKINIERSMAGTHDFNIHTKLYISNPQSMTGALASLDYIDIGSEASLREKTLQKPTLNKIPPIEDNIVVEEEAELDAQETRERIVKFQENLLKQKVINKAPSATSSGIFSLNNF